MSGRRVAQGVAGAAALIAVLTVLARLAGFGRTLVFTNAVGAGSTGDTYTAANNVPNIVYEIVAGGALASLVVPMLAGGIVAGNTEQVRRTASALLGWVLLVLTPLGHRPAARHGLVGRAVNRPDARHVAEQRNVFTKELAVDFDDRPLLARFDGRFGTCRHGSKKHGGD